MYSSDYVWARILSHLADTLGDMVVSTYFEDAKVVELNEENLILYSPSELRRDFIRRRHTTYIQDALKELFQSDAKLVVFDDAQLKAYTEKQEPNNSLDFNPQYSFNNFVVGPSNQFAHAAAIAVSNNPGGAYNPLYIYGPPGVGKTHLLYAIANGVRKQKPDAKIIYIKGDQFTIELVDAIHKGKNVEFRSKYRDADLFLIDDIQFIAGKEQTQEEFFHTFNKLYENHKQIVMTADRKPSDLQRLEERLRSRFEWGLQADVQPPDYETRMAILKKKAEKMGLNLDDQVCNFIAINITNNVRQIEGTVNKILAYRDLSNMPVDLDHIKRVIDDMINTPGNSVPTPSLIISQVCKFYCIDESKLRGQDKTKNVAEARQVAMYLVRNLTNLSTPDIGKQFSKDHSTVLYNINQIKTKLKSGASAMQDNIRDITANINSCL